MIYVRRKMKIYKKKTRSKKSSNNTLSSSN